MQIVPTDWDEVEATAASYLAGEVSLLKVAESMRHFSLTHAFIITVEMLAELTGEKHFYAAMAMDHARRKVWIRKPDPPRRPSIPAFIREQVFNRDGRRCQLCGDDWYLELDHVYPFSRGGSDDPSNLQTLCRRCNRSKQDRLPG